MRASTELARPVAEAHHSHDVPVLLLEEMHRALGDRFLERLVLFVKWQRLAHLVHHPPVYARQLVSGHGAIEGDVEGGVVWSHPRPLLHHLLAERLPERTVQ